MGGRSFVDHSNCLLISASQRWDRLNSVKKILTDFFLTLEVVSQNSSEQVTISGDIMLSQMKALASVKGKSHLYKIQNNVLIAAFNLGCMWRVSESKSFPGLPEELGRLLEDYDR